jgi:hypothetical protein
MRERERASKRESRKWRDAEKCTGGDRSGRNGLEQRWQVGQGALDQVLHRGSGRDDGNEIEGGANTKNGSGVAYVVKKSSSGNSI